MGEAFDDHAKRSLKASGVEEGEGEESQVEVEMTKVEEKDMKRKARTGKWALFLLPFITVVREGLEAVVFVGGVSVTLFLKILLVYKALISTLFAGLARRTSNIHPTRGRRRSHCWLSRRLSHLSWWIRRRSALVPRHLYLFLVLDRCWVVFKGDWIFPIIRE